MAKVEKIGDTFYWVTSYLTCTCDRLSCTGCETLERKTKIEESIKDCPYCSTKQAVVPTYVSIPEPRIKRQLEGQATREGYIMRCSVCSKTS